MEICRRGWVRLHFYLVRPNRNRGKERRRTVLSGCRRLSIDPSLNRRLSESGKWKRVANNFFLQFRFILLGLYWNLKRLITVTTRSLWYLCICRRASVTSFIEFTLRTGAIVIGFVAATPRARSKLNIKVKNSVTFWQAVCKILQKPSFWC